MYCKNCGNKLEENHTFCGRCGHSVNSVEAARQESVSVGSYNTSVLNGDALIWKSVSICNLVISSLMLLFGLICGIGICIEEADLLIALIISAGGSAFSGAVAAVCLAKSSSKVINLITIGLSALFFVLLVTITAIAALVI